MVIATKKTMKMFENRNRLINAKNKLVGKRGEGY